MFILLRRFPSKLCYTLRPLDEFVRRFDAHEFLIVILASERDTRQRGYVVEESDWCVQNAMNESLKLVDRIDSVCAFFHV